MESCSKKRFAAVSIGVDLFLGLLYLIANSFQLGEWQLSHGSRGAAPASQPVGRGVARRSPKLRT